MESFRDRAKKVIKENKELFEIFKEYDKTGKMPDRIRNKKCQN